MAFKIEVTDYLAHIKQLYPTFHLSDAIGEYWCKALLKYDLPTLKRAIEDYVNTEKYAPALCDILSRCVRFAGTRRSTYQQQDMEFSDGRAEVVKQDPDNTIRMLYKNRSGRLTNYPLLKDYAIQRNGKWVRKIDFCMDVLGASNVAKLIRHELRTTPDDVLKLRVSPAKYKQLLNQMTDLALSDLNQNQTTPKEIGQGDFLPAIRPHD
jgi:hypothetical protein